MRTSIVLLGVIEAGLAVAGPMPGRQSLREMAERYPGYEISIIHESAPVDLTGLISNADLVARVRVLDARSFEGTGPVEIMTDYTADIYEAIHQRVNDRYKNGQAVLIRRPCGELSFDGRTVKARENHFPPFQPGEEYVLVLNEDLSSRRCAVA